MTEYATPAEGGDKLPLTDLIGALLRIDVIEALHDVTTSFGPANPVRANVAVLDGEHKADEYDDTLIFPRVLVSQLKPNVGKVVLGRLGRGTAKPGQSAPWTLAPATESDLAVARKYDEYKATQTAAQDAPF
jgi:hypothetical protein